MDTTPSKTLESGQVDVKDGANVDTPKASARSTGGPAGLATVLILERSESQLDPLNWTWAKKHIILFVLSATAFLPDYGAASGASTQIPQSDYWHIPVDTVSQSLVGATMSLAGGGLIAATLSTYFVRLPVLFWLMTISFATAAWCAGAQTYQSFMGARIMNSLFDAVALVSGLIYIQDMFFLHEHTQKINLWSSFFVLAPFLGPQLAAFMIATLSWRWPFWIYTIITGMCLIAIVLFVDESFCDRSVSAEQPPLRKSRWMRVVGVEQWKSRRKSAKFSQALVSPLKAISKVPVLSCTLCYTVVFAWNVGINNTLAEYLTSKYDFGPTSIAVILGEVIGHWLHNFIADIYIQRHRGRFEPEARLIVLWVAIPCSVAGLILFGFCYERNYHYMVAAVAWGLYVFGLMITTVGLNAYLLDSYPEGAGEVAAWLNVARAIGGGVVTYFQAKWVETSGADVCFGIEAAICFGSMVLFILPLQTSGKNLRTWGGPIAFSGTDMDTSNVITNRHGQNAP